MTRSTDSMRPPSGPCESPSHVANVLEHNGGVIDERYKRETGEGSIGRRVRITPAFVDQALAAVVALAGRLEATAH